MMPGAEAVSLAKAVKISVPAGGGVVDVGDVEAGGKGAGGRRSRAIAARGLGRGGLTDGPLTRPSIVHPNAGEVDNDDGPTKDGSKATPAPARPLPRAAKRLIAKIRPIKEGHVRVPDGFGTILLDADQSVLAPTASVVPFTDKAGRAVGLKIKGIRSNGVAVALGFHDGDVIQSVNGRPTKSAEDLVKLVDTLDGAKVVRVRVKRDGRPKTLRIDVDRN
jgi:membrane-associated protease RseP (regulator of RpoE activity)